MSSDQTYGPGVKRYIEESKKLLAQRKALIERVRNLKFDTIAVHGLYSPEEALDRNQGAVIEPVFPSASQAYRDSDELEAALAYLIPTWCYTRIANPTTYFLQDILALLHFNRQTPAGGLAAELHGLGYNPFLPIRGIGCHPVGGKPG